MQNSALSSSSNQSVWMPPWLAMVNILFIAGGSQLTRLDVRLGLLWNILIGTVYTSAIVRCLCLRSRPSEASVAIWPRSMALLGSAVAIIIAQIVIGSALSLVAKTCEITWPIDFYFTFLGPAAVGVIVTLCILAWIEAGGVNPMIDQFLYAMFDSRTYREIQAERRRQEPSDTRNP